MSLSNFKFKTASDVQGSLYGSPNAIGYAGNYRTRWAPLADTEQTFNGYDRQQKVALSRMLFAQMPVLSSTLDFKTELVVGDSYWFNYAGTDENFKKAVEPWINNVWYNNCNVLGNAYDFRTCLRLFVNKYHVDGDILNTFVQTKKKTVLNQVVESHRIASRDYKDKVPEGKLYAGARLFDGCIFDKIGKVIGYYVLGNTLAEDTVIPASECQFIYSPKHFDRQRGLPCIYSADLTALQIQEIHEALLNTIKLESLIAILETNEDGQSAASNTSVATQDEDDPNAIIQKPAKPVIEGITGTQFRYMKPGGKVESFNSNRPAEATQKHITNMERQLVSTIGIPHEVLFSPSSVGGAAARGLSVRVRSAVTETQKIIDKFAAGQVAVAIQNAIDLGLLPKPNENFTDFIRFEHPEKFTLDQGYEKQALLNDYRYGFISGDDYISACGGDPIEVANKRVNETIRLYKNIKTVKDELAKEGIEVSDTQIRNDLQQSTANPIPLPADQSLKADNEK